MALSLINSENFDGSSSLPSGWTFAGGKYAVSTVQFVSSPNSLKFTNGASGIWYSGAYGAADGNSGDSQVSANLYLNTAGMTAGVYLRAAAYPLGYMPGTTGTFYMAQLTSGGLTILRVVNGSSSALATISSAGLVQNAWFNVLFSCQGGASLVGQSCQVTRLSDGQYLTPSGFFAPSVTNAYAGTDTSGIGGSGYAGVLSKGINAGTVDTGFFDDFAYYKILSGANQKFMPKFLVGNYDAARYQNLDLI